MNDLSHHASSRARDEDDAFPCIHPFIRAAITTRLDGPQIERQYAPCHPLDDDDDDDDDDDCRKPSLIIAPLLFVVGDRHQLVGKFLVGLRLQLAIDAIDALFLLSFISSHRFIHQIAL